VTLAVRVAVVSVVGIAVDDKSFFVRGWSERRMKSESDFVSESEILDDATG